MIITTICMNNGHDIKVPLDAENWNLFMGTYSEFLAGIGNKKVQLVAQGKIVYIPLQNISYFVREESKEVEKS